MKQKQPKNIALRVYEIADAYALETLYNEMKPVFPNENIYFSLFNRAVSPSKTLEQYPKITSGQHSLYHSKPDIVISVMSDTTEDLSRYELGPFRTFAIDIALLKAMRKLPSNKEKARIRNEYGLDKIDGPLAVFGNIHNLHYMAKSRKLICSISPKAHIAAATGFEMLETYLKLKEKDLSNVTEVCGLGHLSKLYSIADIAFCGSNLKKIGGRLHNFYEQTQGGPIFLVPSRDTRQYDYKEFVEQGLIRPCKSIEEIIKQSINHLKQIKRNPELKKQHRKKWLAHKNRTKKKFLPEIFGRIEWILKERSPTIFSYIHPESDWGNGRLVKTPIDIFDDSYQEEGK